MNLMVLQLKALRAACASVMAAIDLYVSMAEADEAAVQKASEAPADEERVFNEDSAKCQHPRTHWVRAPAMGNPNRWVCRCGEEMEEAKS